MDFMELAMKVKKEGQAGDLEKFFLIAWSFWYRRNQFQFEGHIQHPQHTVDHALSMLKESQAIQGGCQQLLRRNMGWRPPPTGVLKLNTDGAMFQEQCKIGVGVILRDENGKVVMATCNKEPEFSEPMEVELLAILRGLQLCVPMGINDLIVEIDSLLSVNAIVAEGEFISTSGNLISSI
ncbi:uncharacterized protein LOC122274566 [Carya illinoinensis]|uniref:uncharacterized protein LOC122274566 n=1 Tax=Carya illinoinensis TaxID=32201 RepID=UPI001C717F23|nr:uncharacterized protein LOC122274566 [Carya illinoinensis]